MFYYYYYFIIIIILLDEIYTNIMKFKILVTRKICVIVKSSGIGNCIHKLEFCVYSQTEAFTKVGIILHTLEGLFRKDISPEEIAKSFKRIQIADRVQF